MVVAQGEPRRTGQQAHLTTASEAWPPERWVALVVLVALALLIAVRMGFRGVSFMGARVSV